jgi:UDP-glucose 4-epimerase
MSLDQKLVLIGGAGFVGSHLVDALLAEGAVDIVVFDNFTRGTRENLAQALSSGRVRLVEGSILDQTAVEKAVEGADGVFHLAASWLLQCVDDPRAGLETNVVGTFNVLQACSRAKVRRLVFSSSASVYGNALHRHMTEDHPLNNRTFYGATKIAGEQLLRAFNETTGLAYVALRYFNIYGPRQDYSGAYVSVIMKVLDRLAAGQRPVVFGDGSQAYDFIYVGDVARANVLALKSDVRDDVINVCTGTKTSIRELVDLLRELVGSTLEAEYRPAPQQFVTDRLGDPQKCRRLLGFEATVSLRDGLRELIAWRAAATDRAEQVVA